MRTKRGAKQQENSTRLAAPTTGELQDQIRRRAYELWEQSGWEHGRDSEHWVQAEQEIIQLTATTNQ
jgi:hypothetical protein